MVKMLSEGVVRLCIVLSVKQCSCYTCNPLRTLVLQGLSLTWSKCGWLATSKPGTILHLLSMIPVFMHVAHNLSDQARPLTH